LVLSDGASVLFLDITGTGTPNLQKKGNSKSSREASNSG